MLTIGKELARTGWSNQILPMVQRPNRNVTDMLQIFFHYNLDVYFYSENSLFFVSDHFKSQRLKTLFLEKIKVVNSVYGSVFNQSNVNDQCP